MDKFNKIVVKNCNMNATGRSRCTYYDNAMNDRSNLYLEMIIRHRVTSIRYFERVQQKQYNQ